MEFIFLLFKSLKNLFCIKNSGENEKFYDLEFYIFRLEKQGIEYLKVSRHPDITLESPSENLKSVMLEYKEFIKSGIK